MALRRAVGERRGTASTWLIVGLANPGAQYDGTRHNVGGEAVRELARRLGADLVLERRQRALSATVATVHGPVTLAIPTTFMNESGAALPPLLRRCSVVDVAQLLIVHDELDLAPGRLQLRRGGGLAGHNGLRSIAQTLATQDFARLRIGIGKPPSKEQGADYVLARPTGVRRTALEGDASAAAAALELVLEFGFEEAQRRVNG